MFTKTTHVIPGDKTVLFGNVKKEIKRGEVYIIDRNGTWDNLNKEPSYDVYVESENMLYKHLTESQVFPDDGEDE